MQSDRWLIYPAHGYEATRNTQCLHTGRCVSAACERAGLLLDFGSIDVPAHPGARNLFVSLGLLRPSSVIRAYIVDILLKKLATSHQP